MGNKLHKKEVKDLCNLSMGKKKDVYYRKIKFNKLISKANT